MTFSWTNPFTARLRREPTLTEPLVVIAIIGILLNLPPTILKIICSVFRLADIYQ